MECREEGHIRGESVGIGLWEWHVRDRDMVGDIGFYFFGVVYS